MDGCRFCPKRRAFTHFRNGVHYNTKKGQAYKCVIHFFKRIYMIVSGFLWQILKYVAYYLGWTKLLNIIGMRQFKQQNIVIRKYSKSVHYFTLHRQSQDAATILEESDESSQIR